MSRFGRLVAREGMQRALLISIVLSFYACGQTIGREDPGSPMGDGGPDAGPSVTPGDDAGAPVPPPPVPPPPADAGVVDPPPPPPDAGPAGRCDAFVLEASLLRAS